MASNNTIPRMLDGAWMPEDALTNEGRWLHRLSPSEVEGLDQALRTSQSKGHVTCNTMAKEDFPLNTAVVAVLEQLLDHVENDMGMFVIRGIPVERYSKAEMRMMYWGIGLHLGTAVTQSGKGDLLGDVKYFGHKTTVGANTGRGYMLNVGLSFHTDSADLVSLIVLRTAPIGGRSMICSSIAVRNEIARRRLDLLKILYEDFYWSWKGSGPPGHPSWYKQPVFTEPNGKFAARQVPPHIESAQDFPEVPRLTEKQRKAFNFVDQVANEEHMHFGMMFEPGGIQFLNNHITFHARTEFTHGETEDTKRHLLRMWLAPKNSRELSPSCGFYADKTAGVVRGGFPGATDELLYETPAVDL